MRYTQLSLPGAWLIDIDPILDERGFFARSWCAHEFAARGLCAQWTQSSISYNERRGTLRGMHYQVSPHAETKLVRCTRGAIFDVIVDVRPNAETKCRWIGIELSEENRRMLYVPEGFAHGFLTLSEASEVLYQISTAYEPSHARGVRWNDPAFRIEWPASVEVISQRDADFPDFAA